MLKRYSPHLRTLSLALTFGCVSLHATSDNGLAPEVTDLNAKDISYAKEQEIAYLEQPFISTAPMDRQDGLSVGSLSSEQEKELKAFAQELFNGDHGEVDSLLIAKDGKLLFESYYRRGRINYPHYQMSITKAYTAMAIGRAIALGHLTMADLDKPVINFLDELDRSKLVSGADQITLAEAMNMHSGIRIAPERARELMQQAEKLIGQNQIQAYLEHSAPIPDLPREYKYQAADTCITMQVLESVVPGSAREFIHTELLGKMGITNYHWDFDISGLPKAAAGSSMRSRDMLKWGLMVMNRGRWEGKQLIPAEFVERAVSPICHSFDIHHYGYFWWWHQTTVRAQTYDCITGRGAGGQFIQVFPELNLIIVITAHQKGMGNMLLSAPRRLLPLFN